ncbi:MAG: tRNA (adenosine(37)-N6)-threonylcarbamoyltransferase complex transferase subunit TsaD [Gemmatimonadetes bacterium]|nr:tRNA (adenosine(37)-N6)-threonylcarbamoyltransferase complex transferase subunit TsaD [Gemmatimonadota bacterium]MXY83542.1 tRNA (adenosine(37)-N6)-threonylcarbamoyltransferase complex transferase subunit TsaD [Gemmatimonadota bacterium]MYB70337.1 tRNA (adenosine(37)-N6)-threonylcarbamoyltransferase complex transferase subunit TsaD [Gemmatimonadota bacterium]
MLVLGLETSCDETAAAVVDESYAVHSNIIFSQQDHAPYGGVVPELASRAHMCALVPVVRQALATAGVGWEEVDGVAATRGPGLVGSLIVGLSLAKGLALARNKPLVGVHHLEAHVFSNLVAAQVEVPFLTLLVSGGHTELILVRELGSYQVLGRTRDDAAGEAFDKVAKLLGLLPGEGVVAGGRLIAELAEDGDPKAIDFPRALVDEMDFSFSGLKTSVLHYVRTLSPQARTAQLAHIAASFQEAVVDALVAKTLLALERVEVETVCLAGGVAANQRLRQRLRVAVECRGLAFHCPAYDLCTDNAAMVGAVGAFYLSRGVCDSLNVDAAPRLGWRV